MAQEKKAIGFVIAGIKTEQFALLPDIFTENQETEVEAGIELKISQENKQLGCFATFTFNQQKQTVIKISVSCHFFIEAASWQENINSTETAILFPRDFIVHLAMITVGTTRGVLFAKTEGTQFSKYVLPVIDVQAMFKKDVEFELYNR